MIGTTLGIIAPHPPIMVAEVGGPRARVTEDSIRAMETAARLLDAYRPDTIVLMSPHAPVARDAFVVDRSESYSGDLGQFGARSVRLAPVGDTALADAIMEAAAAQGLPVLSRTDHASLDAGTLDHGAIVPLSFLDRHGRYALVELSLSFLTLASHRLFGEAVARAAKTLGRRVAFIASGDCSHRLTPDAPAGYSPRASEFDDELVRSLEHNDYGALEHLDPALVEIAAECGLRSFIALGGFLAGTGASTRVLSHEGPWGVGYTTAIAASQDLLALIDEPEVAVAPTGESEPVVLARRAIEAYLREHRIISPPTPSGLLAEQHGAFVSLHRHGDLRGCIGTIAPTAPTLAEEIAHNAIQAATADPRFPPLTTAELEDLDISVDVLHEPEPATLEDLDPRSWGVIVSADWRRGLLLPDLEGVDTVEQQVAIARQKAGIGAAERVRLERFKVDRYH
ncbi:MAG: AmmeMemoRadiSam system protein A [Coriobacteriia bacterium]|nr:AmmeMemoRadiSam system protein A [Coriobacteriia bacterium]MBN2840922.1 AmmeMemoRadiSam system protein A [Coriobacteriia bacterium]